MRLWENGFETRLFQDSKVIHKRRTSLKKFAKQVYQFGVARPILNQRHPNYIKPTFWFPSYIFCRNNSCFSFVSIEFYSFQRINLSCKLPFVLWLIYMFLIFIFLNHSI